MTYLNHGTVGAPPRRVIETQRRLQDEIERQPATGDLARAISWRSACSAGLGPKLIRPPVSQ